MIETVLNAHDILAAKEDLVARTERRTDGVDAWCVTSKDDRYRYLLGRSWGGLFVPLPDVWLWVMLNPSTARIDDDMTITKVMGFTKRGGGTGFVVANLMALSETDPAELCRRARAGEDIVGPANEAALDMALRKASRILVAWGSSVLSLEPFVRPAIERLVNRTNPLPVLECLGTCEDGSPRHPSRIGYDRPIVRWAPR